MPSRQRNGSPRIVPNWETVNSLNGCTESLPPDIWKQSHPEEILGLPAGRKATRQGGPQAAARCPPRKTSTTTAQLALLYL